MTDIKVGIIGGTGMNNIELFTVNEIKEVTTPFGKPSSSLICGKLKGISCVLLSRHGTGHSVAPTDVNYRANLLALKLEGCTHVIATTACGSLKEEVKPGHFVIIDQFIDRTTKRTQTFYDGTATSFEGVCHIPMKSPFNSKLRAILEDACKQDNVPCHSGATTITIEGPRFSSLAESNLYRSWGATVINMTTVPEVVLANELGLLYASLAMVTDYDCWRESESVDVQSVLKVMKKNTEMALDVIIRSVGLIADAIWESDISYAQDVATGAVMP